MMRNSIEIINDVAPNSKIIRLSGGISNQTFRVQSNSNSNDRVITIFSEKNKWKADKEKSISNFLRKEKIPSINVHKLGYLKKSKINYRYLLREFIPDKDFEEFLNNNKGISANKLNELLFDFGNILGSLHLITYSQFGLVKEVSGSKWKFQGKSYNSWKNYSDEAFREKKMLLKNIDLERKIGKISGRDIKLLFNLSYNFYFNKRDVMNSVKESSLIHNDLLLKNIIVNTSTNKIGGIIDNEWVSLGDPDIDLIQLENSIHFTSHQKILLSSWNYFISGYQQNRTISNNIKSKRLIYHVMRSLFYLMEIFNQKNHIYLVEIDIDNKINNNFNFVYKILKQGELGFELYA